MKMKPEHFAILQDAVAKLDTADKRKAYADYELSARRYRWDLLYASGVLEAMSQPLYLYLNDSHIDTALRKIVPDGPASLGIPVGQCPPKITDENKESLISAYADARIEDMDLKCLMQLALETIWKRT